MLPIKTEKEGKVLKQFSIENLLNPMPSPTKTETRITSIYIHDYHQSVSNSFSDHGCPRNGNFVERRCGDCNSDSTSGHWSQDPLVVGGYICQKCYRRRKRAERDNKPYELGNKICYECSSLDSVVWFRHITIPGKYLCSPCHNAKTGLPTNRCHACGTHKSTKWSNDLNGNTVCRKCIRKLRNVAQLLTEFSK